MNNTFKGWIMGKNPQRFDPNKGQAIIVIALVMIGLIAIMGLAIDGGGLLFLKRDTQNAVDAALMAGAYARCAGSSVYEAQQAAYEAAARNSFKDGVDGVDVVVNIPPTSGTVTDNDFYVEVIIKAPKPKYFIQLVYSGELDVTTRGVSYCMPGSSAYEDMAIMGTGTNCDVVGGNGSTNRIVGDGYANNDVGLTGSDTKMDGNLSYAGGQNASMDGKVVYYPIGTTSTDTNTQLPPSSFPLIYDIADFAPGGIYAQQAAAQGMYHQVAGGTTFTKTTMEGLYYVTGDITVRDINAVGPHGLTIVATGDIDMNNNKDITFKAYDGMHHEKDNSPVQLLFFTMVEAPDNNCSSNTGIKASGSNNQFRGLIYSPYGVIDFSASQSNSVGALIGRRVSLSGSNNTVIYKNVLPPSPPGIGNAR